MDTFFHIYPVRYLNILAFSKITSKFPSTLSEMILPHSANIGFWFNQLFDLIAVKKVRLIVALRGNLIRNMTDDFCHELRKHKG